jgi:hypothetical protein
MRFMLPSGFGTVSSTILALPSPGQARAPVWRFAGVAGLVSPWETLAPM